MDKASVLDGGQAVTKKQEAVRAVQKKARAVKRQPLKPIEVIVISPDTNEVAKAKEKKQNDAAVSSPKKKVTYTSALNARSKVDSLIGIENILCNVSLVFFLIVWLIHLGCF